MSSVASTPQAFERRPAKRPKYTREDSVPSQSSATPSRREAEERAAQELEAQRRASRQRVLSVWESLEKRYHRDLDDDDIVDLESLTLIQDAGTLRQIKNVPFGSLAAEDPSDSEGEDDEEDELAVWNDERPIDADVRLQESVRKPRLTEEDEQDLEEFLRVEHQRRQDEDLSEDQDGLDGFNEGFTEEGTTTDGAFSETQTADGDERDEDQVTDEEEEASVSSFHPTPDRRRRTDEEETSEDELAAPPASKTTASEFVVNHSEEESSDDELALLPPQSKYESFSTISRAVSKAPSYRPRKALENTQLSTPPRSKSSAFTQASGHSNNNPLAFRPDPRRDVHRSPSKHPSQPIPTNIRSALGKRKRASTSPPPSSPRFIPSPEQSEPYGYHGHGASSSRTQVDRHSHRTPSRHRYSESFDTRRFTSDHDDFDAFHSGRRSPDYSDQRLVYEQRDDDLRPPDMSHLLFHLKKVNEWVKTHHIPELEDEESEPQKPHLLHTPSKKPNFPTFPGSTSHSFSTPRNAQRYQAQDVGSSSAYSNRSFSSFMGPPPTPMKLFQSLPAKHTSSSSSPSSPIKSSSSSRHLYAHSTSISRSISRSRPLDDESPTRRKSHRSFNEQAEGYNFSYRSASMAHDTSPTKGYEARARNHGASSTSRRDKSTSGAPLSRSRRY